MPRYFITTTDGFRADDEEGVVLPGTAELRDMLRDALAEILRDEGRRGVDKAEAEATDEGGRCVMRARISFSAIEP